MRKSLFVLVLAAMLCVASGVYAGEADFHIGVITGTVSQSEDELRGAEHLIGEYGSVADGGMIQHLTYPDLFMQEMETTISLIVSFADDPKMKAIVASQAIPGVTEAFRRVREKNPDILLLAVNAHEDPLIISEAADLATNFDFIARGYLIINTAKELGCDTFVHISFPRHMSYETLSRRRDIMEQACNDLGLKFVFETAPDPVSDVGTAGAQQYILEKVPAWVEKYGTNSAYFCTNDAHTEPLLKQLLEYGGYFIEADLPSPLMGYPGALGVDLSEAHGDFPKILKTIEDAIAEKGGAGRFGTWAYSYGFVSTTGFAELAKRVIEGEAELTNFDDIIAALSKYTPGAAWNGSFYTDSSTGTTTDNYVMVYQDTYIMGKGYMKVTDIEVPEKYLK
jgi:hypothetical protein